MRTMKEILTLIVCILCLPLKGEHVIPVVVILGDSNATGDSFVPLPYEDDRVEYWQRADIHYNYDQDYSIDTQNIPLSSPLAINGTQRHSVEGGVARGVKGGDCSRFVILKVSRAGSRIWDWRSPSGSMWKRFVDKLGQVNASLESRGLTPRYEAVVWIGGTNDYDFSVADYKRNLEIVISDLRGTLGNEELKVTCTRDGTTNTKQAMDSVAESDSLVWSVSTEGYATIDGTHFTGDSLMTLGYELIKPLDITVESNHINMGIAGNEVKVTWLNGSLVTSPDMSEWVDYVGESPFVKRTSYKEFYRLTKQ